MCYLIPTQIESTAQEVNGDVLRGRGWPFERQQNAKRLKSPKCMFGKSRGTDILESKGRSALHYGVQDVILIAVSVDGKKGKREKEQCGC